MSAKLLVVIVCNDCAAELSDDSYQSVAAAEADARELGWECVRVHRICLHFCPKCQGEPARSAGHA